MPIRVLVPWSRLLAPMGCASVIQEQVPAGVMAVLQSGQRSGSRCWAWARPAPSVDAGPVDRQSTEVPIASISGFLSMELESMLMTM